MKKLKKLTTLLLSVMLIVGLVSCGTSKQLSSNENSNVQSQENNDSHYPVTITTYNYLKEPVEITFDKAPERVVAIYQNSIETLLALGLEDKIVAAAGLDHDVKDEYKDAFSKVNYLEDFTPSKETIIMEKPDFILSWYSIFDDKRLGDIDYWNENGVNTYMSLNSGVVSERTIENEINDILNLGKIFNVEDKAQEIVDNMQTKIDAALENVKIADPAVGSGAFALGMLNEIVKARSIITDYICKNFDETEMFNSRSIYSLKKNAMKKSIFAVDIEPSAIDITKLRLWLSLVVDADVKTVNTLPNLDYNIMVGNSLIEDFRGIKLFNEELLKEKSKRKQVKENRQISMNIDTNNEINIGIEQEYQLLEDIQFLQNRLFDTKDTKVKKNIKMKIENKEWELIEYKLNREIGLSFKEIEELKKQRKFHKRPYFLWKLEFSKVFKEKGGFDIVIGNPPYISTKGISKSDKQSYENAFGFSDDTYNMFTFKGLSLIKKLGSLNFIIPKTFWTTQSKKNMRNLIFDTANPFESAMVDTCIIQVIKKTVDKGHMIKFLDGSKDLKNPKIKVISQDKYNSVQNSVIFKPTDLNLKIYDLYGDKVKELYDMWWDKIKTSKDIEKNKKELELYRESLEPGDITLLGCLTEGGQGLATANNGKYIAIRKSTKWAKNIIKSRPEKLLKAINNNNIPLSKLGKYTSISDLFDRASEKEIEKIFDSLKEEYGRDIFGQGYIYKLVEDEEIACVDELTQDEKENGIDTSNRYYVPYDKGDKDGNRWYLETPFAIAWSKENVNFLKTNSGKKGKGMPVVRNSQYYFREGFCWSDINTTYLKCRIKGKSVNDVKSMSLYGVSKKIPEAYFVSLINSTLFSLYVDSFINNTQTFQINDARQLPIIIPTEEQLNSLLLKFNEAVEIKKDFFKGVINEKDSENLLGNIQEQIDQLVNDIYCL